MYTHWMKTVQENARTTLEQTREAMKKDYDRRRTPQPDIELGDLVMLNTKKKFKANNQEESSPHDCTPLLKS